MKSSFHPEAREEFLTAIDAYKEIDPQLGVDFASEVYAGVELIEAFPLAWTEVSFKIRRCLLSSISVCFALFGRKRRFGDLCSDAYSSRAGLLETSNVVN